MNIALPFSSSFTIIIIMFVVFKCFSCSNILLDIERQRANKKKGEFDAGYLGTCVNVYVKVDDL